MVKGYKEDKKVKDNGVVEYQVGQEIAELKPLVELDRFSAGVTIGLGDFQFLRLDVSKSAENLGVVREAMLQDLVDLKNEFLKRHPDLMK